MSTRSVGNAQNPNGPNAEEPLSPLVPHADVRHAGVVDNNQLSELGQKIFLSVKDRLSFTTEGQPSAAPAVETRAAA